MTTPFSYTPQQLKKVIRVPSGDCPVKFSELWDIEGSCPPATVICSWFWLVREYGLKRGDFYTAEAIAYWAQTEFSIYGDEYNEITDIIYEYAQLSGDYAAPTREMEGV